MLKMTLAARTPVVRGLASVITAFALVAVPIAVSATPSETDTATDARAFDVERATQFNVPSPAPAPAVPVRLVANFTARNLAAIRATRSASMFRWGTPAYAKWYAKSHITAKYKWGTRQFGCLVSLWNRESHWGFHSTNHRGRTYGIPQTNKANILEFGTSFATYMKTPELQVQVGAKYVHYRYGSPCAALKHSNRHGWY